MPEIADAQLARRALRGDRRAFGLLVERHRARVFTVALRIVGDRALAEDVASETFLRVWRSLDRFDGSRSFAAWAATIATRLAIDERRRPRSRLGSLEAEREESGAEPEEPAAGPEARAITADLSETVRRAIDGLPERQRAAVVLRHLEDVGYAEIAQALSVPVGTAKTLAYQGRLALARALREWEGESL